MILPTARTCSQLLFCACLGIVSTAAQAVPLTFVETTDLGNTNTSGPTLGAFDIGINTVSGSVFRNPTGSSTPGDYGDFWEADLLAGQQITSIDLVVSNSVGSSGRALVANEIISGFTPPTFAAYTDIFSGDGTYSLTTTPANSLRAGDFPFTADHYYFGAAVFFVNNLTSYDYEWRVLVSGTNQSAPAPAVISMLIFGLSLIGLRRRLYSRER